MTYSTQELIQILDQELKANWRGERILLSSEDRFNNPVVSKAINMDKVNKVFAYQDFRSQIHQYQQDHQVSGIIWRSQEFKGFKVRFPEIHNQLIAIEGDKKILQAAKQDILDFWQQVTVDLTLWQLTLPRSYQPQNRYQKITPEELRILSRDAEWGELEIALTEVYLGLCWGNPQEYQYQWAYPESGCHRIIATDGEPGAIKF